MALSPANTMSIINTCKNAVKADGLVMLEKSLTIAAHMSAGPPKDGTAAAVANITSSTIVSPKFTAWT
jgi:hypothetical protein